MLTPQAFTTKGVSERFASSPIVTPKDWHEIKARRTTGRLQDAGKKQLLESHMAPISMSGGSINQAPRKPVGKLSTLSACWTVMSVFVGLGLLSKPYAVAKGGWASIPILGAFTLIANLSGKMLVNCFLTPRCRQITTYSRLVDEVLGYWGAIGLVAIVSLEFVAALCISMIFIWSNLQSLLPTVPSIWIRLITTAVALPTIWLLTLSEASWLTFLGSISTFLIVLSLIFVRIYYGQLEDVDLHNNFGPDIPLSLGIYMVSLAGHAALPQIYSEMSNPARFNRMMDLSFFMIFLVYASVGVVGYLTYGAMSDIIISTNMVKNPGGIVPKVTTGFILAKNFLTLNPFVSILCNGTEVMMGITDSRMKKRILRSFVFLAAAALSYLASDALPFIESLTGAICTVVSSFILPAIVFMLLKKRMKSWKIWSSSIFFILFGLSMLGLLSYGAIGSLVNPDSKPK